MLSRGKWFFDPAIHPGKAWERHTLVWHGSIVLSMPSVPSVRILFLAKALGTPDYSPAYFFPGKLYPLPGLPLCSPSPLCELALKFFIQAYFLCVLSVFSVFSVRARSFALNPGILSPCPPCEPFFNLWNKRKPVSRPREKKGRLRPDDYTEKNRAIDPGLVSRLHPIA